LLVEINNSGIELKSINKLFEFEKISRDIDSISDIEIMRNFAKLYIKLYFKQQEILLNL
jgi:uncharacterized Fe-S cluster-containing MiaB family protein